MILATYSTVQKTFAITQPDVGRAMLFQGNPYGHNRGKNFKSAAEARQKLADLGFKEIR